MSHEPKEIAQHWRCECVKLVRPIECDCGDTLVDPRQQMAVRYYWSSPQTS